MTKLIITAILLFTVFIANGQVKRVNTRVNNDNLKKSFVKSSAIKISKTNIKNLDKQMLGKNANIKSYKKIELPTGVLKAISKKTWRVTPQRPFTNGLEVSYKGSFDKNKFMMISSYVFNSDYCSKDYFTYAGKIKFRGVKGREYRLKMLLDRNSIPSQNRNANVLIGIEGLEYRVEITKEKPEINLLFTQDTNRTVTINISGINPDRSRQSAIAIKSVRVDQL